MPEIKNKTQINILIWNIILLMLSFFFLPPASPGLTLLLAIFTISYSRNKLQNLKKNLRFILLFSAIFWVYLFGMLFTHNVEKGWTVVILKFSFLAFPLIFGLLDTDFFQRKQMKFLMGAFILITTSSVVFSLIHAAYEYFNHNDKQAFFYARLSYLLHPSYYALYLNVALIAVVCRLLVTKIVEKNNSKILYWFLIPFYIVFLILLESKAGLIGLMSVILMTLIHLIFTERNIKSAGRLAALSLITAGLTIVFIPDTTSRVNQVVNTIDEEEESAANHSASAARFYLWEAAFKAYMEKPVIGHGSGDVKEQLMHQYKIQNNSRALEMRYDAHNQYLHSMVATGILGLLSLLILVGFPMFFSLNGRILFYFLLGFLMAINLLVESMFERQAGVMFYAFFNSLLFFFHKPMK